MRNSEIRLFQEKKISGRYITNTAIKPLLFSLPSKKFKVETIGQSVLGEAIYKVRVGKGVNKVFMWSQMHGNESTTTKALFDLFNFLKSDVEEAQVLLDNCTLEIIPILNPDGAKAYTRVNANGVDLNRDAKNLTQPESKVLRSVFDTFKPDYCFNLHGQRTIFGVGETDKVATVSFLAPSQDELCTITETRKVAMHIIAQMNKELQKDIPNGVGLYDDAFNINCVGDMFQSQNTPTILFEAGHFPNDYNREEVRFLILKCYLSSINSICFKSGVNDFGKYLDIPENEKTFFDIIIKNVALKTGGGLTDIGIMYKEILREDSGSIDFVPFIAEIGDLKSYNSHKCIDGRGGVILDENNATLLKENSYSKIRLNDNNISLKLH